MQISTAHGTLNRKHDCMQQLLAAFSEQEIIFLQDIFMTSGFHHLRVNNVTVGRQILEMFLESLHYFEQVTALTVQHEPLPNTVQDLYYELLESQYINLHGTISNDLSDFFITQFNADFVWIEASAELLAAPWFTKVQRALSDIIAEHPIPILVISYEE